MTLLPLNFSPRFSSASVRAFLLAINFQRIHSQEYTTVICSIETKFFFLGLPKLRRTHSVTENEYFHKQLTSIDAQTYFVRGNSQTKGINVRSRNFHAHADGGTYPLLLSFLFHVYLCVAVYKIQLYKRLYTYTIWIHLYTRTSPTH